MTKKMNLGWTMAAAMLIAGNAAAPVHAQLMHRVAVMEPAEIGEAPQVKDSLLEGTEKFAQGARDVTEVNLDKNMLGMVGNDKSGMANKMDFVVVHSYAYDKPGMYRMEDVEVFRRKLADGSWSCFVHTRDKDGSTDICTRSVDHGETNEMMIMKAEAKKLIFVHLRGRLSLSDLGKMSEHMGEPPAPPPPPAPLAPRQ